MQILEDARLPYVHYKEKRPQYILIAFIGLAALLDVEFVLTYLIPDTNYSQSDGWMARAVIHATITFGRIFDVTNINPLEGLGSQLLPINVWINPAFWPFFFLQGRMALDMSAVISLGCIAAACYVLARCFDVSVLPSIVGAQLVIILFGPLVRILVFFQIFWIGPATAVVYAAQLVALGILARVEPGSMRNFVFATGSIFVLLLYSLACDPLWTLIGGMGLFGAFAVVALSPMRIWPILVRCAALGCCVLLLLASGAITYAHILTQYTARVAFSNIIHYTWDPLHASVVFIPQSTGGFYEICGLGWIFGALLARGRVRVFIVAGLSSFAILVALVAAYRLLPEWWLPLPIYIEHGMFPLFITTGIAGYWVALRAIAPAIYTSTKNVFGIASSALGLKPKTETSVPGTLGRQFAERLSPVGWLGGILVAIAVPAAAMTYGSRISATAPDFSEPLPSEPELVSYLAKTIGLRIGGEFRGYVAHVTDGWTLFNLWLNDIPTVNEYSQLITPQAMYLASTLFKDDVFGRTVWLDLWTPDVRLHSALFKTLPAFGVRYIMNTVPISEAEQRGFPLAVFPSRPPPEGKAPEWIVYELPHPNVGDYSPSELVTAQSGAETVAAMEAADFDFTKQAVVPTAIDRKLVPATHMHMSIIRGGVHVSAKSGGTSLVLLPQQFSHCLRADDSRARLVRADLILTGLIFSDAVDTDILFNYGIFTPGCRRLDLADVKQMQLKIGALNH
jgi:hypothetical protein